MSLDVFGFEKGRTQRARQYAFLIDGEDTTAESPSPDPGGEESEDGELGQKDNRQKDRNRNTNVE